MVITVQELLNNGTVTQSQDDESEVIFNIPIRVKKSAIEAGSLKRVYVGAADSGGTGYKVLRIAN